MIKRSILSDLFLCTASAPVEASTHQLIRDTALTRTVEATGVRVVTDHPFCNKPGMYGGYRPSTKLLIVCVDNHGNDYRELGDTLRHEAIHVAQTCYGKGVAKPILSWNQISEFSSDRILSIVQRYPAEHQHIEYEAFSAAYVLTNNQVKDIVRDFCF